MSFGPYEIVGDIAKGGMGAVYRARHTQSGRDVALKVLLPQLAGDAEFIKRFRHEVTALAQLKHPNIVEILDAGQVDGQHYMAMAHLGGGSLQQELAELRNGGAFMPVRKVLDIARQIAGALDHAHGRQIVHRDIKPANILRAGDGRYVLTDFGIVKGAQLTTVTQNFAAIGTPDYMSPEQAQGLPVDGRSDIYSLGVLVFEMLAGRVPFRAENTPALLYKHVHENAPDLKALRADVPDGVRQLAERMLAKKRDQRFGNARDLVAAIDRLLQQPDRKGAVTGTRRFPVALAGLLGTAAVAGIGLGAWSLNGGGAAAATATPGAIAVPTGSSQNTGGPRATVTQLPGAATVAVPTSAGLPTVTPAPALSTAPVAATAIPVSTATPLPSSTSLPTSTATKPLPTATPTTAPTPTATPTQVPPSPTATKLPTATPTQAPTVIVTSPPLKLTLVPIKTLIVFLPTATPTPKPFVIVPITPVVVIRLPTATPKP